jgi:hypothetical protein
MVTATKYDFCHVLNKKAQNISQNLIFGTKRGSKIFQRLQAKKSATREIYLINCYIIICAKRRNIKQTK